MGLHLLFCVLIRIFAAEYKKKKVMTALELNAELYRAMGEIANDETLLAKVLKYVKDLTPAKKAKADADWANKFAGAWKDNRSTDEIINDINEARTTNSRNI